MVRVGWTHCCTNRIRNSVRISTGQTLENTVLLLSLILKLNYFSRPSFAIMLAQITYLIYIQTIVIITQLILFLKKGTVSWNYLAHFILSVVLNLCTFHISYAVDYLTFIYLFFMCNYLFIYLFTICVIVPNL